nr:hypothetical protein [Actinomycetales bacterium]
MRDDGQASAETYPAAPLRFDRGQVRTVVLALSAVFIVGSFAAQALVPDLVAPVRTVWLSVAVVWLVAIAVVQRRRNFGSMVGWLLVLLSLAAVAWNLGTGPQLWATTWAIPAICTAANLVLGILVWIVRLDPAEYLAKAVMVALIGLVPSLFVVFGWVTFAVPSLVCAGISLALIALMLALRPRQVGTALHRRLQV